MSRASVTPGRAAAPAAGASGGAASGTGFHLRTFARVRPFLGDEATTCFDTMPVARPVVDVSPCGKAQPPPTALKVLDPAQKFRVRKEGAFEQVFWTAPDGDEESSPAPSARQHQVFAGVGESMAQTVVEGFNTVTVVAGFGTTGKHHTLFGDISQVYSTGPDGSAGLIPRFADDVFARLQKAKPNGTADSSVAVEVEVYELDDGKNINDLLMSKRAKAQLDYDGKKLVIKDDPIEGQIVENGTRVAVDTPAALVAQVRKAHANPAYRKEWGHLVVAVRLTETLHFKDPNDPGKLVKKTGKASAIFALIHGRPNAFMRCVDAAALHDSGENPHAKVPYREATLTRLIADFWSGNCRGQFIGCFSPYHGHVKDSLDMVDVAAKLAKVRTHPKLSYDSQTNAFRRLDQEVAAMQTAAQKAEESQRVVQEELDRRQRALENVSKRHDEQALALHEAQEEADREAKVKQVQNLRFKRVHNEAEEAECLLQVQLRDSEREAARLAEDEKRLTAQQAADEAACQQAEADLAAAEEEASDMLSELERERERRAFVADVNQGIGGKKEALVKQNDSDIEALRAVADEKREETEAAEKAGADVATTHMTVSMAARQVKDVRDRHAAADAKVKALEQEEKDLKAEIAQFEKECDDLEAQCKEAESGCCVVQ